MSVLEFIKMSFLADLVHAGIAIAIVLGLAILVVIVQVVENAITTAKRRSKK